MCQLIILLKVVLTAWITVIHVSDTIYHTWDINLTVQCLNAIINTNLNVRLFINLNVQDQHLTIHELSDNEIEFMIHNIATNWTL